MNQDQELKTMIAQLAERNALLERMNGMRGRIAVGVFSEGLQVLLLAARGGDAGAQSDLKTLRDLLQQVLDTSDVASRITVVRRPEN